MVSSPAKIAIIPDGNRRYAKKHSLPLSAAYSQGFGKVSEVLEWARGFKTREVTFWALSLENFQKRSNLELSVLFKLMSKNICEALESQKLRDQKACVRFFGKKELLPLSLRERIAELEADTARYADFSLNVAIAYSGQDELLNATRRIAQDAADGVISPQGVDAKLFESYLYTPTAPDLIIRTGDVQRLSGFLPYQSAYSEYYFSKKLWPEFQREDFADAVAHYESAQRRFGK